ncbi:unnamed protein product, partial [Mesorhabditis belari]|uniref:TOM1-like protein 2 n=1 Tax=Mesorhabditis belari TaxID=2138241 RepID=A0AAF3FR60_9BILA
MSNVKEQVSQVVGSAKEVAQNVGEQVSDFFQGNPFATPVGKKIELATDSNLLATENWGLNMEICDFINGYEDGPKDAIRAIRKRLHSQMGKNNTIVMYTLTVLETCVKNCDHRFHHFVCQKDFILDLVKLIGPKFDAPQIIQERVLTLIQSWADAFRNAPDLQGAAQVYEDLKAKGVEFPATDLDTLAPIITPKRTVFTEPPPQQQPQAPDGSTTSDVTLNGILSKRCKVSFETFQTTLFWTYQVAPVSETPVQANSEQLVKLRNDIDMVKLEFEVTLRLSLSLARFSGEMLTEIVPNKVTQDELQLILELNQACRQMQQRVLELIGQVSNDEVTHELLVLNDEFNSAFEKYERFMSNKDAEQPSDAADSRGSSVELIDVQVPSAPQTVADQLEALKLSSTTNQPSVIEEAYRANAEPQASVGIRQAAGDRSLSVSEREAAEMADWLNMQGKTTNEKHDPENDKL